MNESPGRIDEFLTFRRFITPLIIQVIFWLGLLGLLIPLLDFGKRNELVAVLIFVVGGLAWRMLCELMILFFKSHDELVAIREALTGRAGAPRDSLASSRRADPAGTSRPGVHGIFPGTIPCSRCGAMNPSTSGARFCEKCGASLLVPELLGTAAVADGDTAEGAPGSGVPSTSPAAEGAKTEPEPTPNCAICGKPLSDLDVRLRRHRHPKCLVSQAPS